LSTQTLLTQAEQDGRMGRSRKNSSIELLEYVRCQTIEKNLLIIVTRCINTGSEFVATGSIFVVRKYIKYAI